MKKLLFLVIVSLLVTGCIAVPVYDSGYYPYNGPYHYYYSGPDVSVVLPGFYGGYRYHGGYGYRGGRR